MSQKPHVQTSQNCLYITRGCDDNAICNVLGVLQDDIACSDNGIMDEMSEKPQRPLQVIHTT